VKLSSNFLLNRSDACGFPESGKCLMHSRNTKELCARRAATAYEAAKKKNLEAAFESLTKILAMAAEHETIARNPPQVDESITISYPTEHVMLVTISRQRQMNSIPFRVQWQLHELFDWYDAEPTLRAAIITGAGEKAFCAGMDLKDLKAGHDGGEHSRRRMPPSGFAGLSRRKGRKPIIAAVNGFALGGGFEIVLNWFVDKK
jgi:hypothetical protein